MGKIKLRDMVGLIKDTAASIAKPSAADAVILRTTSHFPPTPPRAHRISAVFALGETSRAAASPIISSLMDRLHRTGDSVVALKCLLLIHHVIRTGPFILQDQLSVFPASGGRNYLKLSSFRDSSSAATTLGYFVCSVSGEEDRGFKISSLLNADLIREIDSLVSILEELCKSPDNPTDEFAREIVGLLCGDYLSAVNEVLLRLTEASHRTSCLSFVDSVELVFALTRLGDCEEKLSEFYDVKKPSIERMWESVRLLREKI
ncbi:hypothetical protein M569_16398, partial [Genlisea aurea]